MLFFGFVFGCIFGCLWLHFWCHFGRYWEVFFDTFPDFVKNGAPHESAVNSDSIEGRAPRQSTKKPSNTEEKMAGKRRRQINAFLIDFGSILGGFGAFWEPKCLQHSSANLDAILEAKKGV